MSGVVRVLIADDHPVVRSGIKGMLEPDPGFDVVGEASSGLEAVALALREHPDVVLMDLQMPGLDGASATTQIKAQLPQTKVLVLTTYATDADIVRAIDAGAVGYLLKDAPHEEIARAVRAAARGETTLAPAIAQRLMQRVRSPAGDALSTRESPSGAHLRQARRERPHRGGHHRPRARHHPPGPDLAPEPRASAQVQRAGRYPGPAAPIGALARPGWVVERLLRGAEVTGADRVDQGVAGQVTVISPHY